jgi:Type VI secretion system/phage-baseplate injector OB domain
VSTFFGKYRGTVINNVDPMLRGRVQVSVPSVLGDGRMSWAEACVPYAGDQVGLFAVPPPGANIWVEFEAGDPNRPILAGCFWSQGQAPGNGLPTTKILATDAVTVTVDDLPGAGGLTVEVGPPAAPVAMRFACTSSGIELSIGASKVVLSTSSVSINDGALEVT